ncbi:hypothetical protein Xhom_04261 [Xenorhabdus hominickii]|uniref:Uncharacterized protein n=1 Tax=Xenorhabdus hominickii TaxID=351679 RepID=A0A2G0Q040_XENHO|nr:hypothetical protein Xhom_04261 [Xenorhabdus hominickii]
MLMSWEQIPGNIANYVTEMSERSQQSCNLKDEGYNMMR